MAQQRPLTFYPLKFEEVITDLLKIKPMPKPPPKQAKAQAKRKTKASK